MEHDGVERPLAAAGEEPAREQQNEQKLKQQDKRAEVSAGGGGGWGLPFSFGGVLKAAEEISRNAIEAAKGIAELQPPSAELAESLSSDSLRKEETEKDRIRKSALDRLERASEDTLLGQGLKTIDSSVESIASGTWNVLGNAWRSGSNFVQKLENSATSLAGTIQDGSLPSKAASLAPSIIETGKSFTTKGIEVLERVGKETMELIIEETGLEVEQVPEITDQQDEDEQSEDLSFDRCFYIYGGPEQLEELEALSSHYALLFNRKKAKLVAEQRSFYDARLVEIQQIFSLGSITEESVQESDKGKYIEAAVAGVDTELKRLCDSSIRKAAKMVAGFAATLGGLSTNEIIQRTTDRLETIHSEGVHRLSELCCLAVSQLLTLGKSVISAGNSSKSDEGLDDVKIDWPDDPILKAKIVRGKAVSMYGDVQKVSSSFLTGLTDIVEAYLPAAAVANNSNVGVSDEEQTLVQARADAISKILRAGQSSAADKIQDAVDFLSYVILCTSMPAL